MKTECFNPIVDHQSKILILGTMPSVTSIKTKQYYGHPNNLFWDIIFRVCIPDWKAEKVVSVDYDTKKDLLIKNNIAVWDVLHFCDRKGSLDKDILNQIDNNFTPFFNSYPKITIIFFNGQKAKEYFKTQNFNLDIYNKLNLITLPSTSPRNTINSFRILKEWLQIKNYI